jgi:inward rectifier potassium channel
LLGVAMSTGVLFSKFARPVANLVFSDVAIVGMRDGEACLIFRVGNERANHVVEASIKLWVVRNERTKEGDSTRRWHELPLQRSTSPVFALSWLVVHTITKDSILWGASPELLEEQNAEIIATFVGLDATLSTTIHARHSYVHDELRWGARFVDILNRIPETGRRVLDFAKFHDVEETPLTLPWE